MASESRARDHDETRTPDEAHATADDAKVAFLHQARTADGSDSTSFKLVARKG